MRILFLLITSILYSSICTGGEKAQRIDTPYGETRVVFDFYFDHPEKINQALYWIRSLMNPLQEAPYDQAPEEMELKVVIHGTEIVTVVKHNAETYSRAVERMKYYASLGVEFKVCGLAAHDYGYELSDFQDFVQVVPSAITELAHWQQHGFAIITPQVLEKKLSIEDIR